MDKEEREVLENRCCIPVEKLKTIQSGDDDHFDNRQNDHG